jgi:hypothetical protein
LRQIAIGQLRKIGSIMATKFAGAANRRPLPAEESSATFIALIWSPRSVRARQQSIELPKDFSGEITG